MHEEHLNISLFIDNELEKDQTLRLLQKLAKDRDLDERFRRYEAISQAIKTEVFLPLSDDFVDQVSQSISDEPTYLLPGKRRYKQKMFGYAALAASLAVVTVIVIKTNTFNPVEMQPALVVAERDISPPNQAKQTAKSVQSDQTIAMVAGSRQMDQLPMDYPSRLQPVNPQFNDYLQAHSGNLYSSGSNFQAYAQVAGYGQQ